MRDKTPHTVCIIGGGMSGLFTGALLAKNGYQVTVLEKNHIIGGGLQSFRRGDAVFNTGLQAFGGYEPGMLFYQMVQYLGIKESRLNIVPLNEESEVVVWTKNRHCYRLPKGRFSFERYLSSKFPDQAKGLNGLLNELEIISQTFDYIWFRQPQVHPEISDYIYMTADQLIRKYLTDEELIDVLGYFTIHHGYQFHHISALEFGMMTVLMLSGLQTIAGGTINLANGFADYIYECEGQIINNTEVCKVHINAGNIEYVEATSGQRYYAEKYVSAISPSVLLEMADAPIFRLSSKKRIETYSNEFSSIIAYLKLKPQSFPYINSWVFVPAIQDDSIIPTYISLVTPPTQNQGEWADTLEIFVPALYADFAKWENTQTGRRGEEYDAFKREKVQKIIEYVAQFYPQIKGAIDQVYSSSPLTVRDYYNNPLGATFSQAGLNIPIKTKSPNLFITGQAVMYQTLFGVAVTSIMTTETILGESIIGEIAKA